MRLGIHHTLFTLGFFCLSLSALSQKTDKVYLRNGDVITGEIKSMKLAKMSFDMDGPGTISIKYEHIVRFTSDKVFEVTFRWGTIVVSQIDSQFFVTYHATFDDIIEIVTIKGKFLQRLSGDLSIGFNYAKSNGIFQLTLGGQVTYKVPKRETGIKVNSVITSHNADVNFSKKQDATLSHMRDLHKKFYFGGDLGWQQNSELGLANRFLINGIVGIQGIADNHNRLLAATGLSLNTEQSSESNMHTTNLDALISIEYKRFFYSTPKFNLNTKLSAYPGLSEWGRVRVEYDLDFSFEIIKDFSVGLTFYENYDSRPPVGAVSKNDFGINFNLSYLFGK